MDSSTNPCQLAEKHRGEVIEEAGMLQNYTHETPSRYTNTIYDSTWETMLLHEAEPKYIRMPTVETFSSHNTLGGFAGVSLADLSESGRFQITQSYVVTKSGFP